MNNKLISLQDRAIIEIKGKDAKKFLQGLISNDINNVSPSKLLYAAMLNAQGRFLYDIFIFEKDGILFVDCLKSRRDEIMKKLTFYKLKADVVLKKNDELQVFSYFSDKNDNEDLDKNLANAMIFEDARNKNMGKRIYVAQKIDENLLEKDDKKYHFRRISLKIAESEYDLTYEKSIILEFGFDELSAIDYQKGCYVGQELTARTHHLGQVRKKLFHVEIDNLEQIEKNCEIYCEGKNIGIILSSVKFGDKLSALALLKTENETQDSNNLCVTEEKNKLTIIN